MSATKLRASGAFAVEFAIVLAILLTVFFAIIDIARAVYMFNTLYDVTRRAARQAASTNFSDTSAMDALRQAAVMRTTPGALLFGTPVTDQHVRVDYMALLRDTSGVLTLSAIAASALPACPPQNRSICTANPNDASCIRFVRVRICDAADASACTGVSYQSLTSFIPLPITLPTAPTITPAESLGYTPGMAGCN